MSGIYPSARLPQGLLANARILPDRLDILPLLPKRKVIVEVGVALGDFTEHLLRVCEPDLFIAIDLFALHELPSLWDTPTKQIFAGLTHAEYYRRRFAERIGDGSMRILQGDSAAALATLDDASVDICYVDADHTYDAVKGELEVIRRKISDDGIIILNDYIINDAGFTNVPYGVIHATHEFMIVENWEMIYLALQPNMFCDVVLRKAVSGANAAAWIDVAAMMKTNTELDAINAELTVQSAALEAHRFALEQTLEAMRASTSWRITAPMRALRRSLERFHAGRKRAGGVGG